MNYYEYHIIHSIFTQGHRRVTSLVLRFNNAMLNAPCAPCEAESPATAMAEVVAVEAEGSDDSIVNTENISLFGISCVQDEEHQEASPHLEGEKMKIYFRSFYDFDV